MEMGSKVKLKANTYCGMRIARVTGAVYEKIIHEPSSIAAAPFISLLIDQYRQ